MTGVIDVTDFLRRKLAWHRRVMCDRQLTELAKTIASLLLHDFDWRAEGDAYRSQVGLAELADCSVRAVQGCLDQLQAAGHLAITTAKGRGKTNRYRFVDPPSCSDRPEKANGGACHEREKANGAAPQGTENAQGGASEAADDANLRSEKGEPPFAQTLLGKPNPLNPPSPEPCERRSPQEGERPSPAAAANGLAGSGLGYVPASIRQHLARDPRFGHDWCVSWIDPCGYDEATKQIHPRSQLAVGRLREALGHRLLRELGVTIGEARGPRRVPAAVVGGAG